MVLPVTTEDLKFAVEYPLDPARGLALAASTVAGIRGVQPLSPSVARVTTAAPDPLIPNRLARVEIFSKRAFEALGKERFDQAPIGSGPYRVRNFVPRQVVELVASETWRGPRPLIQELIFRDAPDAAVRISSLKTGEVDLVQSLSPDQVPGIVRDGFKAVRATIPVIVNLSLDTNYADLRDRRVRLAMNHAVDVPSIIRTLLNNSTEQAPGQPVSANLPGYNPAIRAYPYDLNRARQLMAEAGVAAGFTIPLRYGSHQPGYGDYAQAVAAELTRINIRSEISSYDAAFFQANFRLNRVGPVYLSGFNSAILFDVAGALAFLSSDPRTSNGRYNNPEFDRLFAAQAVELDPARRVQLLQQIMQVLHDDPPAVYLWSLADFWGMKPDVGDFRVQDNGIPDWLRVQRA